ncbi:carbohydrate-binding module family 14 protein [uncultured Pelagimonas sp.]|uniref:carbohydrate-binding module family 14 protein n=1 Tax=uncultured Pelagimonas sp. TaxID=1618102 RepID=UPI002625570C|nr:carbohydrate-binding module family 14 protein [uncultured Pelagimonas sp.]
MTFKTVFSVLALTLTPVLASAECSSNHAQMMTCAEGTVYDATSQSCKPVSS